LALGLTAGRAVLVRLGAAEFASMLAAIPVGSAVVGAVLTPLIFVIGVGLLWKGTTEALMRSAASGRIVATRIRFAPGDTDDEYALHSRVIYAIEGEAFVSEGVHAATCSSEADAKARLARLRAGDPVQVYYRPGAPDVVHLDAPPARSRTVLAVGAWITLTGLSTTFVTGVVFAG
jgi:hypothetical protein